MTADSAEYLKVREMAAKLRCSESTILKACERGELVSVRLNDRTIRIPAEQPILTKSASDRRDAPTHAATEDPSNGVHISR